jgi:transposase
MYIVGLDLGKRKSQVCVQDAAGTVVKENRVNTTREDLIETLSPFCGAEILLEASTSAEWVARALEQEGFVVRVADPRFSLMYAQRDKKVKTDKRDARALCEALRLKAYRLAYRKSDVARRLHAKLKVRKQLVEMRTELITLVRSLCEGDGVVLPRCTPSTFIEHVETQQMEALLFESIGPALSQIASLHATITALDRELASSAKGHETASLLQSMRGVGPITSLAFVAVLDDPTRFASARELTSYLGLVPSERSSGDKKSRPGAITKTGDPLLRAYLYEAAMAISKKTAPASPLKAWFDKLAGKHNGPGSARRARVALARRLARILFAMWRDKQRFDHERTTPRRASAESAAQVSRAA